MPGYILVEDIFDEMSQNISYIKLNYYLKAIESSSLKYLSICYEPNWAIGSGEIQCIDKITKVIDEIKLYMFNKYINISLNYTINI